MIPVAFLRVVRVDTGKAMTQAKALIANLMLLDTNLGRAGGRLRQLEGALKDVGKALAISKRVSDDLTTLDQLLENTHDSLSVAMLTPQLRTPAKYTRRAVEQLKKRVHPVRIKANNVDKKIEPLRKKVSQLQDLVGQMITRLERMGALTNLNLETVKGTQACINAQPDGPAKDDLRKALETFARAENPPVAALNTALSAVLGEVDKALGQAAALQAVTRSLDGVSTAIHRVMSQLSNINTVMGPIRSALRQRITVPYSIKVKVRKFKFPKFWETFEIQTKNFTFTIEQIINGVNVGIKKIEDLLMQGAMKVLGPLLRPLDNALKKITLDIPGLAQVEDQLSQVLATLTAIGRTGEAIAGKGKATMDSIAQLEKIIGTFNIKCPPA